MEGLHVHGQPVKCDRFGKPLVSSFLSLLLPDPAGAADRAKAKKASPLEYIDDLTDYVKRVARKIKTSPKHIWEVISFSTVSKKPLKKRERPLIEIDDDLFVVDQREDDDDKGKEEEDADDYINESDDDDDDDDDVMVEAVDVDDDEEEDHDAGPANVQNSHPSDALNTNTNALRALSLLIANTDRDTEADYYRLLKDTTLPFIKAIRQHGPVCNPGSAGVANSPPEKPGEPLFGVSQRIEALGARIPAGRVSVVGKRALELYRQVYPGHTPPQRVVINEHGHEYLMNQYTETTARKTLDMAIGEADFKKMARLK